MGLDLCFEEREVLFLEATIIFFYRASSSNLWAILHEAFLWVVNL